ncbi:hypothetical protein ACHAPE_004043 [Trichoderma viride]
MPRDSNGRELPPDELAYDYRYVVQPRRYAIFSPLHVNREARAVWLPQFFQPPRQNQIEGLNIDFGTPLINYDTDLFTIFDGWPLDGLENGIATGSSVVDGFIQGKIEQPRMEKSALQRASSMWQMIPQKMGAESEERHKEANEQAMREARREVYQRPSQPAMSHRSAESTTYHQGQSGIPAVPAPVANDGWLGWGSARGPGRPSLCSSDGFPSATVATHLASAKAQLEEAKKQLRDLQGEWEDNVRLERDLRKELASVEKAPGNADHPRMIEPKEQVEQLVLDNTQALDEIEDVSRLNP